MAEIIAISSQKGGVSKTTTAVNLGIGLARHGKKVLLIDLDSQGSLTASLGFREPEKLTVTTATMMNNIMNDITVNKTDGILRHNEGIDLLPANIELAGVEIALVNAMSRETILKQYIDMISDEYDYIIADCAPSMGMITINALAAATSIIIPVAPKYLDVKGLELLLKTIAKVQKQINPSLKIDGVLITMADMRSNYTKDIISLLNDNYGGKIKVFSEYIPLTVRIPEASTAGVSIYVHDPNGKATSAYESLVRTVMSDEK